MSKKNQKYWRRRAIQQEKDWTNRCKQTIEKQLAAHYQQALIAIKDDILKLYGSFANANGLNFDEAQQLIGSKEFREWRMTMQEYLQRIADGEKGLERELNTLAMRPRINRLEKLYAETLQELDKLGRNVNDDIRIFLSDSYKSTYAKNIFDLVKVGGLSVALSKLDSIAVEKVIASRWSGKNFSQRIWTNTKLLSGVLRETISSGVHRGRSIPQMSKMIEDKMNGGYRNAVRLVRTEMNFVNNQAHADSMKDAGVEQYEFMAVMDGRTSQKCRERDGEHFLLEEKVVGENYPPLHPRCRSTVCPFIEGVSRKGTRTAKDSSGKNIEIPAAMKYSDYEKIYLKKEISFDEWKAQNGIKSINSLTNSLKNDKINKNNSIKEDVMQSIPDVVAMELKGIGKADFVTAKLVNYALNPLVATDKATAFEEALGYNLTNVAELIQNIKDNLSKFDVVRKPDLGYGERFQVLLDLVGINGKTATVLTAWIKSRDTQTIRLTGVYVKKRKKKGD